jgi:ArsR family transcriptional regulator, arsenate/arsenite/antimonite-responsive transcriptional repressor / arsenate reductase (thioredoxin)
VITLCDKAREVCPEFGHHPRQSHWSDSDPSAAGDAGQASYPVFQRTSVDINTRIRHLLPVFADADR